MRIHTEHLYCTRLSPHLARLHFKSCARAEPTQLYYHGARVDTSPQQLIKVLFLLNADFTKSSEGIGPGAQKSTVPCNGSLCVLPWALSWHVLSCWHQHYSVSLVTGRAGFAATAGAPSRCCTPAAASLRAAPAAARAQTRARPCTKERACTKARQLSRHFTALRASATHTRL